MSLDFAGVMMLSVCVCVLRGIVSVCFPFPHKGAIKLVALLVWFNERL